MRPPYRAGLSHLAATFLASAGKKLRSDIGYAIYELQLDPYREGVKKLKGKVDGKDSFRYRVGDYRIIFHVDDQYVEIDVVRIGHRREIYR